MDMSDVSDQQTHEDVATLRRLLHAQQEIANALAALPPSSELFDSVLSTVCGALGWSFGAAWQYDRDLGDLRPAAVWNATGTQAVGHFAAASLEQRFGAGAACPATCGRPARRRGSPSSSGTRAWPASTARTAPACSARSRSRSAPATPSRACSSSSATSAASSTPSCSPGCRSWPPRSPST
jgi:hypothetical protein